MDAPSNSLSVPYMDQLVNMFKHCSVPIKTKQSAGTAVFTAKPGLATPDGLKQHDVIQGDRAPIPSNQGGNELG